MKKIIFLLFIFVSCTEEKVIKFSDEENNLKEIKKGMSEEEVTQFNRAFGSFYYYDILSGDFSKKEAVEAQERGVNGKTVSEVLDISRKIRIKLMEKGCNTTQPFDYYACEKILTEKEGPDVSQEAKTAPSKEKEYIKKLELKNIKVASGQKYGFGKEVPGVFGTIINKGDVSLRKVAITIYFLNSEGVAIGEKDYHPILVTEYSLGGDNKPLKPNYEKDFGYSVEDSAPSSWAKKVKVEISDIEFE